MQVHERYIDGYIHKEAAPSAAELSAAIGAALGIGSGTLQEALQKSAARFERLPDPEIPEGFEFRPKGAEKRMARAKVKSYFLEETAPYALPSPRENWRAWHNAKVRVLQEAIDKWKAESGQGEEDPDVHAVARALVLEQLRRENPGAEILDARTMKKVAGDEDIVRYRGDKPAQDIAGTAKSLAPGIVQLAARRAAQGYRDSKASPSIRSPRQLAATRGYIERPKV